MNKSIFNHMNKIINRISRNGVMQNTYRGNISVGYYTTKILG